VTANLCKCVDKDRFDISVCYLKEKGLVGERIEEQGTRVIGVPVKDTDKIDYLTFIKLRKLIKELNIELVHTQDVHSMVDSAICKLTMPRLKSVHTFHFGNYPKREGSFRLFENLFWRVPDRLVSVAGTQAEGLMELYGIPEKRLETVWNGVDVDHALEGLGLAERFRSEGKIVIGSINTLTKQKGMFDLLDVAARLKKMHEGRFVFLVAGDGHLKQPLLNKILSMGLEKEVFLLGWVDSASRKFLPQIDIFFQPSLWEAMSIVLLEAMANGKAIVTTGVGETPRILDDFDHGRVVEPGNIENMADAIGELIVDEEKRCLYGKHARKRYEDSFTADQMTRKYQCIYESLLV